MAALYDGIEPMLADMHRSTKSTYQIQSTFYVIPQMQAEDLFRQTATWQDGAGWSDDELRDGKSRFKATRPGGRIP
jgi:hypothetical protein